MNIFLTILNHYHKHRLLNRKSPIVWTDTHSHYHTQFQFQLSTIEQEFQVNTYTANSQQKPRVMSTGNGKFAIAWESYLQDLSGYGIYAQAFDENADEIENLGTELHISSTTFFDQYQPSLAYLSSGGYLFAWSSLAQDLYGYAIEFELYDAEWNTFGTETQANTYEIYDQFDL